MGNETEETEIRYRLKCNKFSRFADVRILEYSGARGRDVTNARIGEDIGLVDLVLAKDMNRLGSLEESRKYEDISAKMRPLTWDQYEQSRPAEERGMELDPVEKRLMKVGLSEQPVRVYSFGIDGYGRASPVNRFAMQLLNDAHEERVSMVRLDAYERRFNRALAKSEAAKENIKSAKPRIFSGPISSSINSSAPLAAVAAPYRR